MKEAINYKKTIYLVQSIFQKVIFPHTGMSLIKYFKSIVSVPYPHRKSPLWSSTGSHD